ncbi:MAG: PAS domain-containing protein [Campylobacterota bacterium]|nr:PAS domain-containing protein [Campylobacterota bacterium]
MVKNKKLIYGYESGKYSTVFRVIVPIFKDNQYLGSIGIGINPNYFIEKISEIINEKGALFIHKKQLEMFSIKSDMDAIGNYLLQSKLSKDEIDILNKIPKDYDFKDGLTIEKNKNYYMIHTVNIKDFKNNNYAKYLFIQNMTSNKENSFYTKVKLTIGIIIFTIFLFLILNRYFFKFSRELEKFYNKTIKKIEFDKEYMKAVEDNSSNIIITSLNKKLYSANKSFFNFSQYNTVEEFQKKHDCVCDLFVKREGFIGKYINGVYWIEYIEQNKHLTHKAIMIKDDKEFIFKVTASFLNFDKYYRCVSTFSDITELEETKNRYDAVLEATQDGIWDWNLKDNTIYFSPQFKKQVGYEDDELKNEFKTWEDLVHLDDIDNATIEFNKNIAGKTKLYENIHRLKHKDGHWVWILDRGKTIFDSDNNATRMIGSHTDITDIKELEDDLKEKDEMMIAQSRNAVMGEMISMIAHQWRQPLSVISMGANNILADIELEIVEEKSLKEISQEIIEQTLELSNTIDDFKEFFKPIREKEIVLIKDILDNTFNVIGKSLENHNIDISKNINNIIKIETYSRELMQVFINIINNSKEALLEKKPKNAYIKIDIEDKKDILYIKISDNGGGIKDDIIDKIFEPYFSTKKEKTGTGLGLYMSKTIIEKHLKGKLIAINEDDGVSFIIELPYELE